MKCARSLTLSASFAVMFLGVAIGLADEPKAGSRDDVPPVSWQTNYAKATAVAEGGNKMLFIHFYDSAADSPSQRLRTETLDDPQVRRKLQDYVCLRLPVDAKIIAQGKRVVLLEHEAFHEMLGKPGVAIVDYRIGETKLRGMVVSQFPITDALRYTPEQMAVILKLPPGTLTQRTMIYAVRIHPDRPASTDGKMLSTLSDEAESHSQYQANICVQGHHSWESRFHRIRSRMPRRAGLPREVCAESWGGESLVDGAVECVRCWRLSSGHWSAVSSASRFYGYDIKRGGNGVWYATGIVDGD
jgi:hypothetical protein